MSAAKLKNFSWGLKYESLCETITRYYDNHKKFGSKEDNFNIANIEHWDDAEAATSFKVSILKSVDWTINTPTQGMLPSWMTGKTGSILGQFKSFMFAAHQQSS